MQRSGLILACVWTLSPGSAIAAIHSGTILADAAQTTFACSEVTTTQGLGTVTYDDVTKLLSWSYTYGDNPPGYDNGALVGGGSEAGSHFHGPALPGVHASPQIALGAGNPNTGSTVLTPAQGADLLNDLWFLLVHTSGCPDGEIRGQVVFASPVPSSSGAAAGLLVLGILASTIWAGCKSRRSLC